MLRATARALTFVLALLVPAAGAWADSRTVARCGEGFLEEIDGAKVLHVKGTPYEMGYQQGALLRDDIRAQVRFLLDEKSKELNLGFGKFRLDPASFIRSIAEGQRAFVPPRFYEEIRGVADGSGMDFDEILVCNFIPELFHCSGFALAGSATKDGTLYHGRILDYGCDWHLQDHAVLTVAEPEGKVPFVNVTYAGFIGSVTGMNAERVAVGEMGGGGLGHWAGVPMSFLVRMALEEARGLDEAVAVFRDHPRTCQYFYVISDGETRRAVGMEASWSVFGVIGMGEPEPRLPNAFPDTVLLSIGDRYKELTRRVEAGFGTFDAESARHLMDRPVAMKSNLHSVLFAPESTRLWVAHATRDGQPAASQPYQAFQLTELLHHAPDPSAPALPLRHEPPADEPTAR